MFYSPHVEIDPQRLAEVGARLRSLREERGQTQANVAQAVGVHRTYLGRLESGQKNITLGVLYGLADHFGVAAASLLPESVILRGPRTRGACWPSARRRPADRPGAIFISCIITVMHEQVRRFHQMNHGCVCCGATSPGNRRRWTPHRSTTIARSWSRCRWVVRCRVRSRRVAPSRPRHGSICHSDVSSGPPISCCAPGTFDWRPRGHELRRLMRLAAKTTITGSD